MAAKGRVNMSVQYLDQADRALLEAALLELASTRPEPSVVQHADRLRRFLVDAKSVILTTGLTKGIDNV